MIIDPRKVNLSEADIEHYLWENPGAVRFNSEGVIRRVERWIKRQYTVPNGIIDLFGITCSGSPVVVEVKNVEIDSRAITQVCRYAYDIERIVQRTKNHNLPIPSPFKVLVGPSMSDAILRESIACGVEFVQFQVKLALTTNCSKSIQAHLMDYENRYERWAHDEDLMAVDWAIDILTPDFLGNDISHEAKDVLDEAAQLLGENEAQEE